MQALSKKADLSVLFVRVLHTRDLALCKYSAEMGNTVNPESSLKTSGPGQ
jgi:hypothetical protein